MSGSDRMKGKTLLEISREDSAAADDGAHTSTGEARIVEWRVLAQ